eukprot:CAMPEP_0197444156 /NCGR_PEP_ID=MMETSP1175-20131217/9704_1 /TAXON_ID=1003142 /ORGANISM="Triceratium dubium, Strain CCMP147" /LENGTH=553 /DNA_ID=CAMNT_0042974895 /DNA_START=82 /DNA_END=1743 /DNA_ORIENTATION=+
MKVCVGVSASNLPIFGRLYASLSYGDNEFGRTEVTDATANPIWTKMFVLDCDDEEEGNVTVRVLSKMDEREVGCGQFSVADIMAHKNSVVHTDLEDGGALFIYASHHVTHGSILKLDLRGVDLANLDDSALKKLFNDKSDPFYEVRNSSGNVVYTSEVIKRNLDPDWSVANINLQSLCDGNFDAPIELAFFDKNFGQSRDFIGSFKCTVNDLVVAAADFKSFLLSADEKEMGRILVLRAECDVFESAAKILNAAAAAKEHSHAERMIADSKFQEVEETQEKLETARLYAEARQKSLNVAAARLAEARRAVKEAKAASSAAANEFDAIKQSGLTGLLRFQFIGKKLKNVEMFPLFDKSDPFFIIQKQDGKEANGQIAWSHVFISNVLQNNLNPEWDVSEVAIGNICSDNLNETIRIVVFDWNESGRHTFIGLFETSISGIISAQESGEEMAVMDGKAENGRISVPYGEVVGFVDPELAEDNVKDLKEQAARAHYFALGAEHKVKVAKRKAEEAQNAVLLLEKNVEVAVEEAEVAKTISLSKTVSRRLQEMGLGS